MLTMELENITDERITTATWRLRELKTAGLELYEILGGEAGASFLRDDCDRDPEVAYAAIALVYYPTTHEKRAGDQGKVDGAERHLRSL